jgi:Bacterial Ig-like domain (group 2)
VNLNLPDLLATAGLKNLNGSVNLVLDTKAPSGSLLIAAGSVDQRNNYVFEVIPRGIEEGASRSLSYWSTGSGDDTMVTLWNPADEPQDLVFTLFYNGGHYLYPIHLEPHATQMFNISEIANMGVPDSEGSIVPAAIHQGSAELSGSLGEQEHILVSMDAGTYNVRKAICSIYCQSCNGVIGTSTIASPFAVAVNGQTQETFYENWNTGSQYNDTNSSTWSSDNTNIATVQTGLVHGVSAGSANVSARYIYNEPQYTSYWCEQAWWSCPLYYTTPSSGAQGNVIQITSIDPQIAMIGSNSVQITINGGGFGTSPTVNLPTGFTWTGQGPTSTRIVVTVNIGFNAPVGNNSLSVSANGATSNSVTFTVNGPHKMVVQQGGDVIGQATNNPSAQSRFVTYQVQNVDSTPAASIPIAENISLTGWNCNQADPGDTTAHCNAQFHTSSNGILTDEWSMYTGYTPAGCGKNITDHWQWCGPTGSNPPAPNPGITFGTLSGWVHTVDSRINGYTNPPTPMPGGFVIVP